MKINEVVLFAKPEAQEAQTKFFYQDPKNSLIQNNKYDSINF